jgi:hypothetical protein
MTIMFQEKGARGQRLVSVTRTAAFGTAPTASTAAFKTPTLKINDLPAFRLVAVQALRRRSNDRR